MRCDAKERVSTGARARLLDAHGYGRRDAHLWSAAGWRAEGFNPSGVT